MRLEMKQVKRDQSPVTQSGFLLTEALVALLLLSIALVAFLGTIAQALCVTKRSEETTKSVLTEEASLFQKETGVSVQGFILVELLMASILFTLAGAGTYSTFIQGMKAQQRISQSFKTYDPLRLLFIRLESDLRNSVGLRDHPFQGKEDEIQFPARQGKELLLIRYFLKEGKLIRSETEITSRLQKERSKEKILLKESRSLGFAFPYEAGENLLFESFWLEEPYYGIPRGVKLKLERQGETLEKLVSIPQGRTGRLPEGVT